MRVLVDISSLPIASELRWAALSVLNLGDGEGEVAEVIEQICDQEHHPFLLDRAFLENGNLMLILDDPAAEARAGHAWIARSPEDDDKGEVDL